MAMIPLAPALAQGTAPRATCSGEIITKIEIHSYLAGSSFAADAWNAASGFAGMHSTPTRPEVIRAYLRMTEGTPCTELDRSESERLLRAQRFISLATVRPVPDGPGRVRIVVETVDEIPVLVGGSAQGAKIKSLLLGTENLGGRGITLEVSGQEGGRYRTGFGGDFIKYGAFGGPLTLAVGGELDPQGDALRFEFSKPFLTEEQPNGFHIGANELNNYYDLERPTGDDVFLNVRRSSYDVGVGSRIGRIGNSGAVGVLGALLVGEDVHSASQAVLMTDSGLVAAPGLPEVDNRYQTFSVVRVGAFGGIRALTFTTVRGFDAVSAAQDLGRGAQFGLFVGPSIWESQHTSDYFLSGEFYAGIGNPSSFFEMRITGEGRADRENQRWDGVVSYGKFVWYVKPSNVVTRVASLEISGIQHLELPVQLSFSDHEGGLWGFPNSRTVGGQRAVLRLEERRVVPLFTRKADWAVALFADAGKIWAGDVPFGQTSPVRAAAGISLLSAYPAGGKRTYRVDLAIPLNPDGAKFEIRFSSSDQTGSIWRQPNDLAIAHSAAVLQNLGSWTPR
ncbi:MAG: hypothetical protein ACHQSE_14215 [Gemmatimonadales bacterium]